ncbi:RNA exonuclease 4 isoform X1 [Tympanuchus pallidicinctus]|uniref:RNA exonuclease 4 isoform X1 n=1 Tax=Tympanuchus pallidicinctus TaxID=109042 RepID=UPI002286E4C8|nr:RNA exonuclease 4 isoform X1 [Tympanuchus pallidicinctus]
MAKADPEAAARGKGRRRRTRRGAGQHEGTAAQKGPKAAAVAALPRSPQEFSSNWKALQELLKQKANSSNAPLPSSQTYTKKQHPLKEGNSQQDPGTRDENALKPKSTNKKDRGPAAHSPPSAEEKSKKAATDKNSKPKHTNKRAKSSDGSTPVAEPKPSRTEKNKNLNGTKSDGKGCKEKRKNGNVEKEKNDVKHKKRKAEDTAQQPKEADIWFDDVDPKDIEAAIGPEAAEVARRKLGLEPGQSKRSVEQVLVKEKSSGGLTRAVAMDCEMVGVGPNGEDSIVARVSIVNRFGKCIYDKYVKPTEEVTDYRTAVSGIRPEHLKTGEDFKTVQKEVADILNGRILVGHALHNDLKVLFLDHPKKKIRDTQKYKPFRQRVKSSRPSLKLLCNRLLDVQVQTSEHCSIQDAQAAMRLYTLEKKKWEAALKNKAKDKP